MALSLAACGTQKYETLELFAMDTYMTFVAIGDGADDVLADLSRTVNTLESSLSRTVDTSEVSRLNRDGSAVWDEDGAQLLSWALQHSQETDSAFDITIAPLVELWGITSDSPRVPSQAEIDALLPLVGYEHVHQSEFCSISLDEGCSVDLGGIAKGYASDCAAVLFHRSALTGGCANLGGNVYVYGTNAQNKGNGYHHQALYAYKLRFCFSTDAGILSYLDGKEFQVEQVDFAQPLLSKEGSCSTLIR